jgi:D-glycero-alpha-D-manno-heptose-7-phosphate kinase
MYKLVRTPFRVSLFGGGSDYPEYYKKKPGSVLGFSINKYIYLSSLTYQNFEKKKKYLISYSKTENENYLDEIKHDVIRKAFKIYNINYPLHLCAQSEIPAQSGLGSSSVFTVGILNLIHSMKDIKLKKKNLAEMAIHFEQKILNESVGSQDQCHATFGGFNLIKFYKSDLKVRSMLNYRDHYKEFFNSLYLVFSNKTRSAYKVVRNQIINTKKGKLDESINRGQIILEEVLKVFQNKKKNYIYEISELLNESWKVKKTFSSNITNSEVDFLYEKMLDCGAIGGKLCGAGQAGFLLALVPNKNFLKFEERMKKYQIFKVGLDYDGSKILI